MSQLLYNGRIEKVKFSLSGTEDARKDSYVPITTYDLFRNNQPYPGGLFDQHMGTTDYAYRCSTCYNNKRACPGHEGNIPLNYCVWNPIVFNDARKWLRLTCHVCGNPVIESSNYMRLPRSHRLDEASKIARTGNRKCVHCKASHPVIKKDPNEPLAIIAELVEDGRQVEKWTILPHKASEIFSRIKDDTVINLGKEISSHPRNYVLWDIKVPSVTVRPDVKKIGGGRSTNDDLTTMLQIIIKKNDLLPTVIPQNIDPKLEKAIFDLNNAYFDFVKAGGEGAMNSLSMRLKGKTGRFRKNQMGKRSHNMCRSTIVGSPLIKIDEVGVPLVFAKTIQYKEPVQEYNKAKLLQYIQNGRKKYPGATKIIKKNTGTEYDIDSAKEIELENGDIVLRDMVDGDPTNFNRQPSLTVSNISTHRASVIRNDNIKTLQMNVITCPLNIVWGKQVAAVLVD